jgi:hypothetical protein
MRSVFRISERLATYRAVVAGPDFDEGEQTWPGDTSSFTDDELIEAIKRSEELRKAGRERTGRLLAELHQRGKHSWPAIARITGIRQTTAYELAQPFLQPDLGDEQDPDGP